MKKKSKIVKSSPEKPYNLLVYVEDSTTKIKRFSSTKKLGAFIESFVKKYPDYMHQYSDNWIDFSITEIAGRVDFFTDGIEMT
jgi:hypothetical protein